MDAAVAHQRRQALTLKGLAGGMGVEKPDLRDSSRAHESRIFIELRTSLHTAAARDAAGEGVSHFLILLGQTRAGAKIVGAVNRHPRFNRFQILKEHIAVHGEIADHGKLFERLHSDRLLEIIDQGRAGHAGASIDEHGARAADLFETIGVVGDGRCRLALAGDGVSGDLHEGGDHVHARMPGQFELFPVGSGSGSVLALDCDDDGLMFSHFNS